jgi:hypothetical protein
MPKQQEKPKRRLKVSIALFDEGGKQIAKEGDELEEGILGEETVAWLLSDGKAVWMEGE